MTEDTNKPVHRIRLSNVSASIFANENDGRIFHNVMFDKSYKVEDEWKRTQSFGRDDLPVLTLIAQQAFAWIHEDQRIKRGQKAMSTNDSEPSEPNF